MPVEGDIFTSVPGSPRNALRKGSKEVQGHSKQVCPRTPIEVGAKTPEKNPNPINLTELRPGNTEEVPSKSAWDPQGMGGATDAPEPQVLHKVQQYTLRYVFIYKKPDTLRYIFICKKHCTLR